MFLKSKLEKIEEEILTIRGQGLLDSENFGNSANLRKVQRGEKIAILEAKRNFILERRNGWKAKIFWNVVVAIIVFVITTIIYKYWLN